MYRSVIAAIAFFTATAVAAAFSPASLDAGSPVTAVQMKQDTMTKDTMAKDDMKKDTKK